MKYVETLVGLVLLVAGTNWLHHLVMMSPEEPSLWVYGMAFSVLLIGLFLAFPDPAAKIVRQLRDAVPFLQDTGEADA